MEKKKMLLTRRRKIILVCAVTLCLTMPFVALGLGSLLNTISIHGTINPNASMGSIVLDLGNMTENSTGGVGPIDENSTLTVPQTSNVTLTFANVSQLSPFTAFQVQMGLYLHGSPIYWGTINQGTTTFTILNVTPATYEVWLVWSYTTGLNPANVSITIDVSSSP